MDFLHLFILIGTVKNCAVRIGHKHQNRILAGNLVNLFRDIVTAALCRNFLCGRLRVADDHTVIKPLQKNGLQQPEHRKDDGCEKHEITEELALKRSCFTLQIYIPPLGLF